MNAVFMLIATSVEMPTVSVGTQMVVAISVGLLVAFAVQFLLTNLGLALGLTALKYQPKESKTDQSSDSAITLDLSWLAGLGILLTLNLVLFTACFLAVRFGAARDPISGATLGIVIWSTYFLILLWVSYSAVDSLMGWIFGSLATGLGQLTQAIAKAFRRSESSDTELLTEAGATKLIQQEIQTALTQLDLQEEIEQYIETIPPPQFDLASVGDGFAEFLKNVDWESFADIKLLQSIDRHSFITLIEDRTTLSTSEADQVVSQLENIWQAAIAQIEDRDLQGKLLQWVQTIDPEKLQLEPLLERLEQALPEDFNSASTPEAKSWWKNIDWLAIKNALLNRVDLSDVDIEEVWQTLQSLYQKVTGSKAEQSLPFNTIQNDVESFLWSAPAWQLSCDKGYRAFKEVIYDSQADPIQVRTQLEPIQKQNLIKLLQQRDDLEAEAIDRIAERLDAVRKDVFSLLEQAEWQEQQRIVGDRLRDQLNKMSRSELLEQNLPQKFEQLLISCELSRGDFIRLLQAWSDIDKYAWLKAREDLDPKDQKKVIETIETIGDRLSAQINLWQEQIASITETCQQKLEDYLRYTSLDYLTPEKIDLKLEQLWEDVSSQLPQALDDDDAKQATLPNFNASIEFLQADYLNTAIDQSNLIEILERRQGLETERVEAIAEHILSRWQELHGQPAPSITQTESFAMDLSEQIVEYLYQAIDQNLASTDIEIELSQLFDFAKSQTTTSIKQQLAQLNWHEIETKLKKTEKYSESQIKRAIKSLRQALRKLLKLPRRWAIRTSDLVSDTLTDFKDFVSHSNKAEFSPERLGQHFKTIFKQSKSSAKSLGKATTNALDEITQLTPATVRQSLALREDLNPDEVEQIGDRLMTSIQDVAQDLNAQQQQMQHKVRSLLDQIGNYLSSLNLFQLNSDKLKAYLAHFDFHSLTNTWQETVADIPLEQLGDRLGELSYEALVKITQANERLSESALAQLQTVRGFVTQQVDTLKASAYERTETLKQQTLQKVESTRKTIAAATYWMLAISFSSAITAALAGYLATLVRF